PMVRRPVLREIVRADLLRPVPGSDLALARLRALGVLALLFRLVEARPEDPQRLGLVLVLALLVLAVDHDARGEVGDAHGGVRGIHALAAGTARAHHVDAQLVL